MKRKRNFRLLIILLLIASHFYIVKSEVSDTLKPHRVIISTDIGGTDYDDFQSMVHLLVYADTFDIEGIISSPHGDGRKEHILEVISEYEKDYPKLTTYSSKYPSPDSLRSITKQGETEIASPIGFRESTEGSNWIIECANRDDPRPLHILIWGSIEDLAQALHDAPEILPKLRVYFIGGPNKKWSVNAYQYIVENFPDLWIIESNATYRGWFLGGNQTGEWHKTTFVQTYIKGFGALGDYFNSKGGSIKMGDTPSLMRLFYGTPEDPSQPSWGGQFVPAWERPHKIYNRLTTQIDSIEQFGVLELRLPFDPDTITDPYATMDIDRKITGLVADDTVKFLFSPKNGSLYSYTINSNIPSLNDSTGYIMGFRPSPTNKDNPSPLYSNWWTDDPSTEFIESGYIGVKTLNIHREDFLGDFADRMYRCAYFANTYFKLNTIAKNGTITRDISDTAYLAGSKITLTARPDSGYKFINWAGDASGTDTTLVITMDTNKTIIAQFGDITDISKKKQEKIIVYPTNFKDFVTISNLNTPNEPAHIELYDLSGKQVNKYKLNLEQKDVLLDLSALLPGTYIIRICYGIEKSKKTIIKTCY